MIRERIIVAVCSGIVILGLIVAAVFPLQSEPVVAEIPETSPPPVQAAPPPSEGSVPPAAPPPGNTSAPPAQEKPPSAVQPPAAKEPAQPPPPPSGPSVLISRGPQGCGQVALTFDAGAGADGAASILANLKKHGVRSTFYLTGKWTSLFQALSKQIVQDGHEVANHTQNHPDLTKLTPAQMEAEIRIGAEQIALHTGAVLVPQFRPPYGAWNDTVLAVVGKLGYPATVYWSIDTLDWQQPPADVIAQRVLSRVKGGDIVLMHLGAFHTGASLDLIIPGLKQKGLIATTVSELLACQAR